MPAGYTWHYIDFSPSDLVRQTIPAFLSSLSQDPSVTNVFERAVFAKSEDAQTDLQEQTDRCLELNALIDAVDQIEWDKNAG